MSVVARAVVEYLSEARAAERRAITAQTAHHFARAVFRTLIVQRHALERSLALRGWNADALHEAHSLSAAQWEPFLSRVLVGATNDQRTAFQRFGMRALRTGVFRLSTDVGVGVSFNLDDPRAARWMRTHGADLVTRINETTRDRIADVLTDGVEGGWSYQKLALELREDFGFSWRRSVLIARTETANAFAEGTLQGALKLRAAGLRVEKQWLVNEPDDEDCIVNGDSDWIDIEDAFPSGHHRPPVHPNCECDLVFRTIEDEETKADAARADYRGSHTPPGPGSPDARMDDVEQVMPDYYEHPEYYAAFSAPVERQTRDAIMRARGKPDAEITVYRSVPREVSEINPGDWVTVSRTYARDHGEEDWHVLSKTVLARELWNSGDAAPEFGWHPDVDARVDPARARDAFPVEDVVAVGVGDLPNIVGSDIRRAAAVTKREHSSLMLMPDGRLYGPGSATFPAHDELAKKMDVKQADVRVEVSPVLDRWIVYGTPTEEQLRTLEDLRPKMRTAQPDWQIFDPAGPSIGKVPSMRQVATGRGIEDLRDFVSGASGRAGFNVNRAVVPTLPPLPKVGSPNEATDLRLRLFARDSHAINDPGVVPGPVPETFSDRMVAIFRDDDLFVKQFATPQGFVNAMSARGFSASMMKDLYVVFPRKYTDQRWTHPDIAPLTTLLQKRRAGTQIRRDIYRAAGYTRDHVTELERLRRAEMTRTGPKPKPYNTPAPSPAPSPPYVPPTPPPYVPPPLPPTFWPTPPSHPPPTQRTPPLVVATSGSGVTVPYETPVPRDATETLGVPKDVVRAQAMAQATGPDLSDAKKVVAWLQSSFPLIPPPRIAEFPDFRAVEENMHELDRLSRLYPNVVKMLRGVGMAFVGGLSSPPPLYALYGWGDFQPGEVMHVGRLLLGGDQFGLGMNPDMLRNPQGMIDQKVIEMGKGYWTGMPPSGIPAIGATLTHEFGHMIHNYLQARSGERVKPIAEDVGPSQRIQDIIMPTIGEVLDKYWPHFRDPLSAKEISQYATKSEFEAFAEAFRELNYEEESKISGPAKKLREMLAYFDKRGVWR